MYRCAEFWKSYKFIMLWGVLYKAKFSSIIRFRSDAAVAWTIIYLNSLSILHKVQTFFSSLSFTAKKLEIKKTTCEWNFTKALVEYFRNEEPRICLNLVGFWRKRSEFSELSPTLRMYCGSKWRDVWTSFSNFAERRVVWMNMAREAFCWRKTADWRSCHSDCSYC